MTLGIYRFYRDLHVLCSPRAERSERLDGGGAISLFHEGLDCFVFSGVHDVRYEVLFGKFVTEHAEFFREIL